MFTFKLRFDTIKNKPFSGSKNVIFTKKDSFNNQT